MTTTVGVIVVNYNGGDLTLDCLRSVVRTDWPAQHLRVALVDNASSDGVVARVRAELPVVRVVESQVNAGFGTACNLGIRALPDVDALALVNNDATVEPGWLRPLVETLDADQSLGAACPKILFADRFHRIDVESPTVRRGWGDHRDLGVYVAGARIAGADVWSRTQLVDGFWGTEPSSDGNLAQWTGASARIQVPAVGDECELLLSAEQSAEVRLTSVEQVATSAVGVAPRWVAVPLGGTPFDVVNNVGTELTGDGYGRNRGMYEPDRGQYDEARDVFAWCGAGVLLRRAYLDDVGLFDERLFLYYEDLELSWRGAKRGWRYRTVPGSVVRHVHAASSVEGSSFKRYHDERNHLIVLARHADAWTTARAAARSLLVTAAYARRDIVAPLIQGRPAHTQVVGDRLRALASAFRRR